jgi:hypothetical protein
MEGLYPQKIMSVRQVQAADKAGKSEAEMVIRIDTALDAKMHP